MKELAIKYAPVMEEILFDLLDQDSSDATVCLNIDMFYEAAFLKLMKTIKHQSDRERILAHKQLFLQEIEDYISL